MFDLDRSKNDTAITIDFLRALAAQLVCVGHALSFFLGWHPSSLPYMQNVGVLLFFLISGFLITRTLAIKSNDPSYGFKIFFIERFSRIYSGLIPALLFVVIVDGMTIYLAGAPDIARYYDLQTLLANLAMLTGYRGVFASWLARSEFGSASPLWTLTIEWHIYMFVGAAFFAVIRPKSILLMLPLALIFSSNPIHYLFGAYQADGVGFGLFILWLMGALVYFAGLTSIRERAPAVTIGILGSVAFVAVTPGGHEYNLISYFALFVAFFGLATATQFVHRVTSASLVRCIGFFADYSYSLYLIHYTIMYAFWIIIPARGFAMFALAVIASNAIAIVLAEVGEKHHKTLAKKLMAATRLSWIKGSQRARLQSSGEQSEKI